MMAEVKTPTTDNRYEKLHGELDQVADKLCEAVNNKFDFTIQVDSNDMAMQKLAMLINFVLDSARRSIEDIQESYISLMATKSEMNAILDNAPNAIISLSPDGKILSSNAASEQVLECTREELAGINISEIISEKNAELFFSIMSDDGLNNKIEVDIKLKNGEIRPVELSGCRYNHNKRIQLICIIRDLTEIREQEKRTAEIQKEYREVSRHAGKAEVATEILHNVGNILNSVNVTISLICSRLKKMPVDKFSQAANMLEEYKDIIAKESSSGKGALVVDYIKKFSDKLSNTKTDQLNDFVMLADRIDHIKAIVKTQQEHAKLVSVIEDVDVNALLDDLLELNKVTFSNNDIRVIKNYGLIKPVVTDRHKLMSVLVNVINNARDALKGSPNMRTLNIDTVENEYNITIKITDNGVGISSDNLMKIFNHGFTTKDAGHGFGLHSCANTIKELGGELELNSDGNNCGCEVLLQLPVKKGVKNGV